MAKSAQMVQINLNFRNLNWLKTSTLTLILFCFSESSQAYMPPVLPTIYKHYGDIKLVERALALGVLDGKMLRYLDDDTVTEDKKMALIDALRNSPTRDNAQIYEGWLINQYKREHKSLNNIDALDAKEAFLLGNLLLADGSRDDTTILQLLTKAHKDAPDSFTRAAALTLAQARAAMRKDYCSASNKMLNLTFTEFGKPDMRWEALLSIRQFAQEISVYCKNTKNSFPPDGDG